MSLIWGNYLIFMPAKMAIDYIQNAFRFRETVTVTVFLRDAISGLALWWLKMTGLVRNLIQESSDSDSDSVSPWFHLWFGFMMA